MNRLMTFFVLLILSGSALAGVFGENLFTGNFKDKKQGVDNGAYKIAVGDTVSVKMWGAYTLDESIVVDAKGYIFIPQAGPVSVLGVRSDAVQSVIERHVKKTFKSNVSVYASLSASQPVSVYVTGYVVNPGMYHGLSADSILNYIDRAGGIDKLRGSFTDIHVKRGGEIMGRFNLYHFILNGDIDFFQFRDGDSIVVSGIKNTVSVSGEVENAYSYEIGGDKVLAKRMLNLARLKPNATHARIVRNSASSKSAEYIKISDADEVYLNAGDEIIAVEDKHNSTISISITGDHAGEMDIVVPSGTTFGEIIDMLTESSTSDISSLQLFRRSVAIKQKEMLEMSLKSLEANALTSGSATKEIADLRLAESEMIMKFIERARQTEPKGQVVVEDIKTARSMVMMHGDRINIPSKDGLVMVHGEVMFPIAVMYDNGMTVSDYIERAGGYSFRADKSRYIIMHKNGVVDVVGGFGSSRKIRPGDEILVLPEVDVKGLQVGKEIMQIIYQIAVATSVVVGL